MKISRIVSVFVALVIMFAAAIPVSAQLGTSDESQFSIQNISGASATVTVTFFGGTCPASGCTPAQLNASGTLTNPFSLAAGASVHINVSDIPVAQLPAGQYSVVISSTGQVAAVATVIGTGTNRFQGSYTSFSTGSTTFFLPSVVYDYVDKWDSMISVQNLGSLPTNILVTITCSEPASFKGLVGTLSATNVPSMGQKTWALKTTSPTNFTRGFTKCNGSAVVTSTSNPPQPIVATDNQSQPLGGNTQSFSGVISGFTKLYAPALFVSYAPVTYPPPVGVKSWNSSINILKMAPGDTTVTVTFSNGGTHQCLLGDSGGKLPSCLLYMPSVHNTPGTFGAIIESSAGIPITVLVNSTRHQLSSTYEGLSAGTLISNIPIIMKNYLTWISSFTCINVGTVATTLNVKYGPDPGLPWAGYNYNTASLAVGAATEILSFQDTNIPNGYLGNATITAQAVGAKIACTVGYSNPTRSTTEPGDWTVRFSAFGQ